eukprot:TRINITY_DN20037_c0_g1_i5.p1 TRINITY_DN20037_c0_g1~~TRINITY_DN20037_c0_g1_i5.p1  ORF type:complete len:212 (-),score=47.66 TRINITY_DN20037_c0_g1_i5:523-1158(-)
MAKHRRPSGQAMEIEEMERSSWREDEPGWIHFSIGKAPWVPFSVRPSIASCMLEIDTAPRENLGDVLHRAESALISWIVDQILGTEARPERFRNLGRGWLFIFLQREQRKFKWWFESIGRVLANHMCDVRDLNLTDELLEKYTDGYMHNCEVVMCMKGMLPAGHARQPMISIMKMDSEYALAHRWASTEETQKALKSALPSDEARRVCMNV